MRARDPFCRIRVKPQKNPGLQKMFGEHFFLKNLGLKACIALMQVTKNLKSRLKKAWKDKIRRAYFY